MNSIELVVFDMAGTTIEHGDQVSRAFETALNKNDVPATEGEIENLMGASKREVIRLFVERHRGERAGASKLVERAYSDFGRTLREYYSNGGTSPIAGVEETFDWLHGRGIKVALTTGFDRSVADTLLEAVGWGPELIDASVCSDEVPQGRPAPFLIFRAMEQTGVVSMNQVIAVGDTALDLHAGSNAGAHGVVGVLSGSHDLERLGKARHTHILPSVADLPRLIESELS